MAVVGKYTCAKRHRTRFKVRKQTMLFRFGQHREQMVLLLLRIISRLYRFSHSRPQNSVFPRIIAK